MRLLRRVLAIGGLAVVVAVGGAALWGGMVLGGWELGSPRFADLHGYLIVLGFLGTLIGIERAMALRAGWAWSWPVSTVLASAALMAGLGVWVGGSVFVLAGGLQLAVLIAARRDHLASYVVLMVAGIVAWLAASSALILEYPAAVAVPALACYLVFTVAAVRLELMGLRTSWNPLSRILFWLAVASALAGSVGTLWSPAFGTRAAAAGLFSMAAWLIVVDIPRRVLRLGGLGRQMAVSLLVGYAWLAGAGIVWGLGWLTGDAGTYGAAVHAVFLGFAVSMMMAHAPVVVPMLARRHVTRWPSLAVPLGVLHASVVIMVIGDLVGIGAIARWGGLGTGIAFVLIGVQAVAALARSRPLAPIPEVYIP